MTKGSGSRSTIGNVLNGSEPARSSPQPRYEDVDRLKSAEGIVGIISQRRSDGVLTFGFFREYERDGATERTTFYSENLGAAFAAHVKLVLERVAQLREESDKRLLSPGSR